MIVAESIGFAATHTISSILADLPGYRVTHGSQNFETAGPIGSGSQTPEDFAASMAAAAAEGLRPVALHTNFDPRRFRPACEANGITYRLLIRRPEAQIDSCYAWAVKKVMEGDDQVILMAMKTALPVLPKLQLRASLPNLLYAYAVQHVCSFNLLALNGGAEVLRMEELLSDETRFRTAFDVPDDTQIPHFSGEALHLASHRAQKGVESLAPPDRAAIRSHLPLAVGEQTVTVDTLGERLGYAA